MYNIICFEKKKYWICGFPLLMGDYTVHKLVDKLNLKLTRKNYVSRFMCMQFRATP